MDDFMTQLEHDPKFAAYARAVFESLPYFIAIDENERVVYINKEYADAFGMPQEEIIGKKVTDAIPWSELPKVVKSQTPQTGCVRIYYPDRGFALESNNVCSRVPVWKNGEIAGAVGVTTFTSFNQLFETAEEARQMQSSGKVTSVGRVSARLIGQSPAMVELRRTIERVANSDISVCITGETGTGKELIADAIHRLSPRRDGPLVKINCASIPKELLESELFGYVPGAFTGASRQGQTGKFVQANGGTILLDEIAEMSLELQSKLLRVLQDRQVEPVGGSHPISLDIRVLSSTNRNLWELVDEGKFRRDLFYRLNSMEISAPPLRARLDDLPLLCPHFIAASNLANNTNVLDIRSDAYDLLRSYPWPGNVRELQHAIDRACVLRRSGVLTSSDFKFLLSRMAQGTGATLPGDPDHPAQLRQSREQAEKEAILAALINAKGNKSAAARALGIDRTALYAKIKRYQIHVTV